MIPTEAISRANPASVSWCAPLQVFPDSVDFGEPFLFWTYDLGDAWNYSLSVESHSREVIDTILIQYHDDYGSSSVHMDIMPIY